MSTQHASGLRRPYAGAEALYVEASRRSPDASRVVFFVRAVVEHPDVLAERLPEALKRVQARHPLLRTRFGPDGFEPSDEPIPFEVVTADEPHAATLEHLETEWRIPAESSLFRVRLLVPRGPTGRITLLVRGHHAACDGFSLTGLSADLLRALCDPASLPVNTDEPPPDVLTVARQELGPAWKRPAPLARAALGLIRRDRGVKGPIVQLAAPGPEGAPLRCRELLLDRAGTQQIRERCREEGVALTGLLAAAAALACESPGRIDLGIAVDLRRRVKRSRVSPDTVGFYGSMTDVALAVPPGAALWDLAADATLALKSGLDDAPERPFATALVVAPLLPLAKRLVAAGRTVFPQTLLLSNAGEVGDRFAGIAETTVVSAGFASSPRASRKLHLSCTSVAGALSLCFAWPEGTLTGERVARFADALRRLLAP